MCRSLAAHGHKVFWVVSDENENEVLDGINIISVGKSGNSRFSRMFSDTKNVYKKVCELKCDVSHFHDPELLIKGLKLKKKGFCVIYDSHEDTPRSILSRSYIWKPLRFFISFLLERIENYIAKRLTFIITATPFIKKRFLKLNKNTEVINNYPTLDELDNDTIWKNKEDTVCFIGGINVERGIYEMIEAAGIADVKLKLAGIFESDDIFNNSKKITGWNKVNYFGQVNRETAKEILSKSKAGLVTYHPHPNHVNAQPNKLFEYMSASVPVILSNFPLWQSMLSEDKFGICVDPMNANDIAKAINYIINNLEEAEEMGKIGRKAVLSKYNWKIEEKKLLQVYNKLITSSKQ